MFVAQAVYSPGSWDGLRNELNDPVTRGNGVMMLEDFKKPFVCKKCDIKTDYYYHKVNIINDTNGFLRISNILSSPSESEAIVGWSLSPYSSSLCHATPSCWLRYLLHSTELNVIPALASILFLTSRSSWGHCTYRRNIKYLNCRPYGWGNRISCLQTAISTQITYAINKNKSYWRNVLGS